MENLKKEKAINPRKGLDKIWSQKGIIEISMELIKSMSIETARAVFQDIFVIDTENKLYTQTIKYFAISPLFREVKEGESAPEYRATAERFKDGTVKVQWDEVPPFTPEVHDIEKKLLKEKNLASAAINLILRIQKLIKRKRHA